VDQARRIVLNEMERYDEALPIMRQACEATRANLGDAHFGTADCNLRLGIIQFKMEHYSEALALFEPVADTRERVLGADAEGTWISSVWLARGYQFTGQLKRAQALFERIYATANRVDGEGDAKSVPFGQMLGTLPADRRAGVAEKLRRKLLEQSRRRCRKGHTYQGAWDLGETWQRKARRGTYRVLCRLPQWDAKGRRCRRTVRTVARRGAAPGDGQHAR
jgi:tetratricopeptide (TPR) repeat protein